MAVKRGYTASKEDLLARLARIEGQVRGVAKMVEEDRYCIDVLTQVAAARAALERISLGLLDGHARLARVADRAGDVGGVRRPDDQLRATVDPAHEHRPRLVVVGVVRADHPAVQFVRKSRG